MLEFLLKHRTIILVILLVIIIYMIFNDPTIRKYWNNLFDNTTALYKKTNGYLDENARLTLTKIKERSIPSPEDFLYSALILDRNVIQNEQMHNTQNILNAGFNYMNAIALGALIDYNDNGNMVIDIAGNFGEQWGELMTPLTEYANVKKIEKIKERVESVKGMTDNKKEASELYLEISTVHTNDTQNVHDSSVNRQVKAILEIIISETSDKRHCIEEIVEFYKGRSDYDLFTEVIDVIRQSEFVIMIGISDKQVLELIWKRIHNPINEKNKDNLLDAFYLNLLECHENGSVVCANGRVCRMINSLSTLDANPKTWELMKLEDIRNMIFDKTRKIIQDVAQANVGGKLKYACLEYGAVDEFDPNFQKTGDELNDNEIETPREATEEETKELEDIMKLEITTMIDDTAIQYNIDTNQIPKLKMEAVAAII